MRKSDDSKLRFFKLKTFVSRSVFGELQLVCENPFEKILNRSVIKFQNGNGVNVIAAELRLAKTRLTPLYKKHNLL